MRKDKRNIIVIGAGPSGLFTTYLLLKSGEKNVTCYEKENFLGGDWSESLPEYTHSTTALSKNSKANDIFTSSFNLLHKKNKTSQEWLDKVSIPIGYSSSMYREIFKNISFTDIFKLVVWYKKNKKDIYTISLEKLYKETRLSQKSKNIANIVGNLTVDSSQGTSFGTLVKILIENLRPSSLFLGKSLFSPYELKIPKNKLWEELEKSIDKLGGKVYKNAEVKILDKNNIIIKNNIGEQRKIKLNKNDKIVVASSEGCLLEPNNFLMNKWANINIKNFPPIGHSASIQIVFEKKLNTKILNSYSIASGVYTDWNLVVFVTKSKIKNVKDNTLLSVSVIGDNYKSSFTGKTFAESSVEERRKEVMRQIKNHPELKGYQFPKIKEIWGGDQTYRWATTGLIPNGQIKLKKNKRIYWSSFLRYPETIVSMLDSAANASIMVTKEITGKEPIKMSNKKSPLSLEIILTVLSLYGIYKFIQKQIR